MIFWAKLICPGCFLCEHPAAVTLQATEKSLMRYPSQAVFTPRIRIMSTSLPDVCFCLPLGC